MITDWQIQSFSRQSAHTGKAFEPGDTVICLLIEDLKEGISRVDVLESEVEAFQINQGEIIGRWVRTIKDPGQDKTDKNEELQTTEELFISLAQSKSETDTESTEDSNALLYLLALFLERKRVLKSKRGSRADKILFTHVKTKEDYAIKSVSITPELMIRIQDSVGMLVA